MSSKLGSGICNVYRILATQKSQTSLCTWMNQTFSSIMHHRTAGIVSNYGFYHSGGSGGGGDNASGGSDEMIEEDKHPDAEKEPLPDWPDGVNPETGEKGGPKGLDPTRYGDWENKGRVSDF